MKNAGRDLEPLSLEERVARIEKLASTRYIEQSKALKKAEKRIHELENDAEKATHLHKTLTQFGPILQKTLQQLTTRVNTNESDIRRIGSKR